MIYLTLPELLHIAERAVGSEPDVRDYGLLESAAARPRATAFGGDAYPDLDAKAAALLHSLAATAPSPAATRDSPSQRSSPSTG